MQFRNNDQKLLLTGDLTLKNIKAVHKSLLEKYSKLKSIEISNVVNIDITFIQMIIALQKVHKTEVELNIPENQYNILNNSGLIASFSSINIQN